MALSLRRRPKTLSRHQCRRIVRLLHRSCCPLSFCGLENSRRLPGIRSSSAQLLHSGVLHVHLASFVFGTNCAPLPTTAAFSSPAMDCTPPPFSSPGVAKTGHPLSFRNIAALGPPWLRGFSDLSGRGDSASLIWAVSDCGSGWHCCSPRPDYTLRGETFRGDFGWFCIVLLD